MRKEIRLEPAFCRLSSFREARTRPLQQHEQGFTSSFHHKNSKLLRGENHRLLSKLKAKVIETV
jgi:hypothetical protein